MDFDQWYIKNEYKDWDEMEDLVRAAWKAGWEESKKIHKPKHEESENMPDGFF